MRDSFKNQCGRRKAVAQMLECLASMHETLGLIYIIYTAIIAACERYRLMDHEFTVILSYISTSIKKKKKQVKWRIIKKGSYCGLSVSTRNCTYIHMCTPLESKAGLNIQGEVPAFSVLLIQI